MLADDTLRPAEWKKVRTYAKDKIDFVAELVLAEFRSRGESNGQQ